MLDSKWFEGYDKKFMFMYYSSDNELMRYSVRMKKDSELVDYLVNINGQDKKDRSFKVAQGKVPNLAFRFYLIMLILGKELERIDLQRIQVIIDEGFNDEKEELIKLKKEEAMEQIAKAQIEKEEEQREYNKKFMKQLNQVERN